MKMVTIKSKIPEIYSIVSENDCEQLKQLPSLVHPKSLDLSVPNKDGLTVAYLACSLNKPDILKVLHDDLHIDLSKPCDYQMFGTPAFYAVQNGYLNILETLWELGYDLSLSCDQFDNPPMFYARHKKNEKAIELLDDLCSRSKQGNNDGNIKNINACTIQRVVRYFLTNKQAQRNKEMTNETD